MSSDLPFTVCFTVMVFAVASTETTSPSMVFSFGATTFGAVVVAGLAAGVAGAAGAAGAGGVAGGGVGGPPGWAGAALGSANTGRGRASKGATGFNSDPP